MEESPSHDLIPQSMITNIADSVLHCDTASEIWRDIEERYGQSNASGYYQIQREIAGVSQRSSYIASNYTKLRKLWDELKIASFGPSCTCEVEPQCNEGKKLIHFLTGLNDTYSNVRMTAMPILGKAYCMLLVDT
ncbi:uncharacterized protein [Nicotiana sylvestris]|uniref:uncharacterized protein n=1 Tax=Nicotiana sylvestris TaxID=4096 RepID=UPI00388CCD32